MTPKPHLKQGVALLACLSILVLSTASRGPETDATTLEAALAADGLYAIFETNFGRFACALEFEKTPVTVGSFVGLAEGKIQFRDPRTQEWVRRPFYDGLRIHRVVKDFVIQGGDPLGDGTGGPGYEFIDEFHPELKHEPGVLSMVNSGPGTNGSQFFITLNRLPHLNNHHTVFGKVVFGFDVLERLSELPTGGPSNTAPIQEIVMTRVKIFRRGAAAEAFDPQAAFEIQDEVLAQREVERRALAARFQAQLERQLRDGDVMASGIRYVVQEAGEGSLPEAGDIVTVHYVGYLDDGTQFDSSYDREAPFRFSVGSGLVIKGWDEVLITMRSGEKRRVVIPPAMAYGERGHKRFGIPPDATLIFDVKLIEILRH
ncbi:MAG: peptidylprolyl isomerase [Candidatus Latescibacterota bacterium]|nr:MAG: peptidylprolyl isomerase [Candidatus Latescibacterota bacterium]